MKERKSLLVSEAVLPKALESLYSIRATKVMTCHVTNSHHNLLFSKIKEHNFFPLEKNV